MARYLLLDPNKKIMAMVRERGTRSEKISDRRFRLATAIVVPFGGFQRRRVVVDDGGGGLWDLGILRVFEKRETKRLKEKPTPLDYEK